jgi:uncharacterized protein YqeY
MKLGAIRFLNAAIKSREIELREKGTALTDADIIGVSSSAQLVLLPRRAQ